MFFSDLLYGLLLYVIILLLCGRGYGQNVTETSLITEVTFSGSNISVAVTTPSVVVTGPNVVVTTPSVVVTTPSVVVIGPSVVTIPDVLYSSNCVIPNVDPSSMPSSEAFDVVGIVNDCASACSQSTLFTCQAYTWAGPGTYCVLHGAIDLGRIIYQSGSNYSITDVNFAKIDVSEDQLLPSSAKLKTMNQEECELYCDMKYNLQTCTSYAYNSASDGILSQDPNCVIMSRNVTTTKSFPPGSFQLYENPCNIADYNGLN
uniref:Apple domain-containing protein n=1 Tax=Acrobeloides nanus TaxID=290746 RepID=A0A914DAY9_9BILA